MKKSARETVTAALTALVKEHGYEDVAECFDMVEAEDDDDDDDDEDDDDDDDDDDTDPGEADDEATE